MVLTKASWTPPRLPRPPGRSEYAEEGPSSPASAGLFAVWAANRSWPGAAALSLRNWRLDSVLGLRPGLLRPNQSPTPSHANSLAFEANARVVLPKAVNSRLIPINRDCVMGRIAAKPASRIITACRNRCREEAKRRGSFRLDAVGVDEFGPVRDLVFELRF